MRAGAPRFRSREIGGCIATRSAQEGRASARPSQPVARKRGCNARGESREQRSSREATPRVSSVKLLRGSLLRSTSRVPSAKLLRGFLPPLRGKDRKGG